MAPTCGICCSAVFFCDALFGQCYLQPEAVNSPLVCAAGCSGQLHDQPSLAKLLNLPYPVPSHAKPVLSV